LTGDNFLTNSKRLLLVLIMFELGCVYKINGKGRGILESKC